MAKPIRKYGKGAISLAVFENAKGGSSDNEFYSLQRSRKIGSEWKQYTVSGKPVVGKDTYFVYFYSIGLGTIWLDDAELVPVGGKMEE